MMLARPFTQLYGLVHVTFSTEESAEFIEYCQDLLCRLEYLEMIVSRYQNERATYLETMARWKELEERKDTTLHKEYFEAQVEIGKLLMTTLPLIHLDADSFFIFARILPDRVPPAQALLSGISDKV